MADFSSDMPKDNRHLADDAGNQKLTKDDITSLRKQGVAGEVNVFFFLNFNLLNERFTHTNWYIRAGAHL